MDSAKIADYEKSRPEMQDKPFRSSCYAPYTSLYFNTNGDVIACCKNTTYVLGNVGEESLEQIWRGKKANAMRRALQDYKFGLGCDFCEWQIQGGQYDQVYARVFDELPVKGIEAEWPARMEFTVSNTCNLACVMCYGVLSSTIRAHREKLPPLPKVYDDRFFADLRKFLPHLKDAKFFGGEPFLAQENYRIWDMMIEDGIVFPCHVTTNGTQWNKKVERILEALPCSISVSMDGVTKATVESIRVNADFETVRANVEKFLAYTRRRGTGISFTYCLMRQNWHEFGEYLRFGEERGVRVFINTVINPDDCSLYTLPPEELRDIARRMEEMDAREGYSKMPRNGAVWTSGVQSLWKNADDEQRRRIGDFKQAKAKKDPITRAWVMVGSGQFDKALAEVADVGPANQGYYFRLCLEGHVLRRQQRFADAEQVLDKAIDLHRRGPSAFVERAWLRIDTQRFAEAVADAEAGLKNTEGNKDARLLASAWGALGVAQGRSGNLADGVVSLRRATEFLPDAAHTHITLGWALLHAGKVAEALAACERAVQIEPASADAAKLRTALSSARA
ncbi:MAG: radical SAM protein [Planctomycetes bacterium]|nr:radical SAM protein [Planctomycetota bacterium]